MKKNNCFIGVLIFLLFNVKSFSQEIEIIKDSICKGFYCFELQELVIQNETPNIYLVIQKTYDLFDGKYFDEHDKRLQYKKNIVKQSSLKELKENQYGTEKYYIYFQKNNVINFSMDIQFYGSSWEGSKYYCFDLANDKNIGIDLFINHRKLLQLCKRKLKREENISLPLYINDLSNYKFEVNEMKNFENLIFIFYDLNDRSNSGYAQYEISFTLNEIRNFLAPLYVKKIF